ncbi:YraN family protein [Celeribacter litoreus]|uniref:YraN family protein n=1 Tax=Celeribacter litoreus TaxID=2876714 RepID=UPI0029623190|nr:YraN family protein [Celeribacter litoreus]
MAREYLAAGCKKLEQRWRGPGGEIDLIFARGGEVIFVEVKASRTHERAAESLSARQIARLCASAEAYIGAMPGGLNTPMRLDVALVDGAGVVEILENALMA